MPDQTRLSEDDRFDLALRAATASRTARPVLPVLVGAAVLIAGLGAVLWAASQRAEARERLAAETRRLDRVVALEQRFAAIETRREQGASGVQDPLPDLFSRLEKAATDSGLAKPSLPTEQTPEQQGLIDRQLTYTFRGEPLESVLAFIDRAMLVVPGLEVHSLDLTVVPGAADRPATWNIVVKFARWERP